jgi:acyl-CoA thioester hydrolase
LAARAATVCVTFDFRTDRPRRITAEERGILRGFLDEPAEPADPAAPDQRAEPTHPALASGRR